MIQRSWWLMVLMVVLASHIALVSAKQITTLNTVDDDAVITNTSVCLCHNHGICDSEGTTTICVCGAGFTGDLCSTRTSLSLPPFKVGVGFIVVLIAAWNVGKVFPSLMLPLITGYLFTGALAGPFFLNIIPTQDIRKFDFVDHMAVGFITLAAGGKLHIKELKSRGRALGYNIIFLIIVDMLLGLAIMFCGRGQIGWLAGMSTPEVIAVALLTGTIMIARSPSSAIALVQELRAKGHFTTVTLAVTIVMDLAVIIIFGLAIFICDAIFASTSTSPALLFGESIARLVFSLIAGGIFGAFIVPWGLWSWPRFLPKPKTERGKERLHFIVELVQMAIFLVLCWIVFVIESFYEEWVEGILVTMVGGAVLANWNRNHEEFQHIMHTLAPYIFLVDFTYTGAGLAFDQIGGTLVVSLILFCVRTFGLFLSSYVAGRLAGEPENHNRSAGLCYVTQAGVSIGLAKQVNLRYPGWGGGFTTMIVTSVIFTQIFGPPLNKWALRSVGETNEGPQKSGGGSLIGGLVNGIVDGIVSGGTRSASSAGTGVSVLIADSRSESVELAAAIDTILSASGWRTTNVTSNALMKLIDESSSSSPPAPRRSIVKPASPVVEEENDPSDATDTGMSEEVEDDTKVDIGDDSASAQPVPSKLQEALKLHVPPGITSVAIIADDQTAHTLSHEIHQLYPEIIIVVLAQSQWSLPTQFSSSPTPDPRSIVTSTAAAAAAVIAGGSPSSPTRRLGSNTGEGKTSSGSSGLSSGHGSEFVKRLNALRKTSFDDANNTPSLASAATAVDDVPPMTIQLSRLRTARPLSTPSAAAAAAAADESAEHKDEEIDPNALILPPLARLVHSSIASVYLVADVLMGGGELLAVKVMDNSITQGETERLKEFIKQQQKKRFDRSVKAMRARY